MQKEPQPLPEVLELIETLILHKADSIDNFVKTAKSMKRFVVSNAIGKNAKMFYSRIKSLFSGH